VCIDRDGRSAADLYMAGDPPCEREVFPCRFPFLSLLILKVLHGAAAGRLDVDPFSPICLDSRFFNDKRKTWRASRGIIETRNETALGFSREKSASRYRASGPRDAHRRGEIALKVGCVRQLTLATGCNIMRAPDRFLWAWHQRKATVAGAPCRHAHARTHMKYMMRAGRRARDHTTTYACTRTYISPASLVPTPYRFWRADRKTAKIGNNSVDGDDA